MLIPGLPSVPAERLSRMPLKTMLGQIRFPIQPQLVDPNYVATLHSAIQDAYPRMLQESSGTVSMGGFQAPLGLGVWRLTDLQRAWSVIVTPEALSVETTAYTVWNEFADRFRAAIEALSKVVPLRVREGIGLRYVNEIHEPAETAGQWQSRINPSLLGLAGVGAFQPHLLQALTEARLQTERAVIILRYGPVHQAGTRADVPFFLLDIDCTDSEPVAFEADDTVRLFGEYNEAIFRIFRWSLTDDFYAQLRG